MNDKEKIKEIVQSLSKEIQEVLPEILHIYNNHDESINQHIDEEDLLYLIKSCREILSCDKFFGLSRTERLMMIPCGTIPLSVKRSLGIDGALE